MSDVYRVDAGGFIAMTIQDAAKPGSPVSESSQAGTCGEGSELVAVKLRWPLSPLAEAPSPGYGTWRVSPALR
jgi:hypothetical protein